MEIENIESIRKFESWPSYDLIYEWEDAISKECNIHIKSINKLQFYAKKFLSRLGIANIIDFGNSSTLFFEMTASPEQAKLYTKNRIPIIVDYFLDKNKTILFIKNISKSKLVFISSREVYEFLLKNGANPAIIKHLPLSISDIYKLKIDTELKKEYDLILLGRLSPTFETYLTKYRIEHPHLSILYRKIENGHFNFYNTDGIYIGNADSRESYMNLMRKSRILLYSTPGYDGEKTTNGFSQVTPRFLEALSCGCHILMRYPMNEDVRYFELDKFAPSVESYEEFERQMNLALESAPGGLIKCEHIDGCLFHTCGGHVFNSKRDDVLKYFWNFFNQENEFIKTNRNSSVFFNQQLVVPYPVEDHIYKFDDNIVSQIITDILQMPKFTDEPHNFEEFLKSRFGTTLYNLYFGPYNDKIWRRDLSTVPLSWLEGKLPMPSPLEIIYNNIRKVEEKKFVHSSFWYPRKRGSQFLADRFAEGLSIRYSSDVNTIERIDGKWIISGEKFDKVVFCGNIRQLPNMINLLPEELTTNINALEYHGTTSVLCKIDNNPYSWIYLPNKEYDAHRIICTGNFSSSNNADNMLSATVEFTDEISEADIKEQLKRMPLNPQYLTHKFNECTYPIQDGATRALIQDVKNLLQPMGMYITGRFADWEYFNMDVAIGAAMDTCKMI